MQTIQENVLNVTLLEPRQKHPTIFVRFDQLQEGETLTIHNDHDPKPLYYQLLGERGNIFHWEYTEQGPTWWKVNITKKVSGEKDETLGELAAKDIRKAEIFKKYGLDFCCGGKKTVKEACSEKGIDVTKLEQELQQADKVPQTRPLPYNEWPSGFLADYIVNTHHSYIRQVMPDLKGYASKVLKVHGAAHPELAAVHNIVSDICEELTSHMIKEERVLFPYIKELENRKGEIQREQLGTVKNPINLMEMEHELVGEKLEELRAVTNNYKLPDDACASYKLLFAMLQEFESDMFIHIHLENNILFPSAIKLEQAVA